MQDQVPENPLKRGGEHYTSQHDSLSQQFYQDLHKKICFSKDFQQIPSVYSGSSEQLYNDGGSSTSVVRRQNYSDLILSDSHNEQNFDREPHLNDYNQSLYTTLRNHETYSLGLTTSQASQNNWEKNDRDSVGQLPSFNTLSRSMNLDQRAFQSPSSLGVYSYDNSVGEGLLTSQSPDHTSGIQSQDSSQDSLSHNSDSPWTKDSVSSSQEPVIKSNMLDLSINNTPMNDNVDQELSGSDSKWQGFSDSLPDKGRVEYSSPLAYRYNVVSSVKTDSSQKKACSGEYLSNQYMNLHNLQYTPNQHFSQDSSYCNSRDNSVNNFPQQYNPASSHQMLEQQSISHQMSFQDIRQQPDTNNPYMSSHVYSSNSRLQHPNNYTGYSNSQLAAPGQFISQEQMSYHSYPEYVSHLKSENYNSYTLNDNPEHIQNMVQFNSQKLKKSKKSTLKKTDGPGMTCRGKIRGGEEDTQSIFEYEPQPADGTVNLSLMDEYILIEKKLSHELATIYFRGPVHFIYNPLDYAFETHIFFLKKYLTSQKDVLFVGMNPGPFGMSQNGVPFGEVNFVRDWMEIEGNVSKPFLECPKRPILGLHCGRSEVSGRRFWGFFKNLCQTPENFFRHCFVYNICPYAFMAESGRNVTPTQLQKEERLKLEEYCDNAFCRVVQLLKVKHVICVGKYSEAQVTRALERLGQLDQMTVRAILHPSPINPAANKGWDDVVYEQLKSFQLLNLLNCNIKQENNEI